MAIVFALEKLFDDVQARFTSENIQGTHYFGWREPAKHKREARRVVWVPGDPNGSLGDIVAPANPGATNPRPLLNINELFTIRVEAFDISNAENERTQYHAARELLDSLLRAIYLAARGNFVIVSADWDQTKKERQHGAAIVLVCYVKAVVPDVADDVAPDDTRIESQTSLDDVTETTMSSEPPP